MTQLSFSCSTPNEHSRTFAGIYLLLFPCANFITYEFGTSVTFDGVEFQVSCSSPVFQDGTLTDFCKRIEKVARRAWKVYRISQCDPRRWKDLDTGDHMFVKHCMAHIMANPKADTSALLASWPQSDFLWRLSVLPDVLKRNQAGFEDSCRLLARQDFDLSLVIGLGRNVLDRAILGKVSL